VGKSQLEEQLLTLIREAGLPEPEREYRFHPDRKWRFDLCWPGGWVAIEVEGGVWIRGRHTRGSGFVKDCEKYNEAAILGWCVLRVPAIMIKDGHALDFIKRALIQAELHQGR